MKKFRSPNYTQVPNEFFDDVLAQGLSKAELTVTLILFRETFGFHRGCTELLTIDELQERTNLSRTAVVDGLSKAEERGYVGRRRVGEGTVYEVFGVRVDEAESRKKLPAAKVGKSYRRSRKKLPPSNKGKKTLRGKEKHQGADAPSGGLKNGGIKGKPGSKFQPDPDIPAHAVIVEIFEFWLANTPQPDGTYLTVKRAQQIRARMREQVADVDPAEALTVARARMLEGLQGWVNSDWHREREAFGFDVFFRSKGKVDEFRRRAGEQQRRGDRQAATGGDFSDYGGVVERG